jgi:hypothetical protein
LDKFFYNVPLEYDKKALQHACENMRSWPYYSTDQGVTDLGGTHDILWPMNIEALRIKNMLVETTNWSFANMPPGGETGWHTDSTRGATLIIPVDKNPHLIKFRDNEKEYDFYYSSPILTNAKYLHNGINYTDAARYNLLFHFETDYETLCKKIDSGNLLNTWLQYYKYNIDTDINLSSYFNTNCTLQDADFIITDKNIHFPDKTIFIGNTDVDVYSNIVLENNYNENDLYMLIKTITESPTRIRKVVI